jgi:hypothetical protein
MKGFAYIYKHHDLYKQKSHNSFRFLAYAALSGKINQRIKQQKYGIECGRINAT